MKYNLKSFLATGFLVGISVLFMVENGMATVERPLTDETSPLFTPFDLPELK